ncbi:hypothetical protein ACLOJK_038877, partial [Asimina triloba]
TVGMKMGRGPLTDRTVVKTLSGSGSAAHRPSWSLHTLPVRRSFIGGGGLTPLSLPYRAARCYDVLATTPSAVFLLPLIVEDGSDAAAVVLLAVGGWIDAVVVLVKGTLPPPVDDVLAIDAASNESLEIEGSESTHRPRHSDRNGSAVGGIVEKSIAGNHGCRLEDDGGAPKLVLRQCTESYVYAVEFGPSVVHRTE